MAAAPSPIPPQRQPAVKQQNRFTGAIALFANPPTPLGFTGCEILAGTPHQSLSTGVSFPLSRVGILAIRVGILEPSLGILPIRVGIRVSPLLAAESVVSLLLAAESGAFVACCNMPERPTRPTWHQHV